LLRLAAVNERDVLLRTAELAADFVDSLDTRHVFPDASREELADSLGGPLPDRPSDPLEVIEQLATEAGRGIVASPSGRYFGFVIGGALPAALAADWLTSAWDQNACFGTAGPAACVVEEVAGGWLRELLGLPVGTTFAFTTGCQMAHVTALAAARQAVLQRAGWNPAADGLAGSPPIAIVAGAGRHVTLDRALRLLGIGTGQIESLPADDQGRMDPATLGAVLDRVGTPAIVCAQAGEVNTGAFDPLAEIAAVAHAHDAWVHVDAAFGMWAAASPSRAHLVEGLGDADSWATDAHKWLNVPYDCGIAFCTHPHAHRTSMASDPAAYLPDPGDGPRDPFDWTPDASRRARGFTVYAALKSLGRGGVAELVDRCCDRAAQFAASVAELPGCTVLNEVVLNQVLFRFEDEATNAAVLARVEASGEAWLGGTSWGGRPAIRFSVSNWRTSEADVDRTLAAFEAALAAAA
jgi:glutamate/tyrosine decarboxylase-like PLP-dependent enzyme